MLAATKSADNVIVNALGPQFHQGLEPSRYGRPGRIPGSVNVPAATLVDEKKKFVALAEAETAFSAEDPACSASSTAWQASTTGVW